MKQFTLAPSRYATAAILLWIDLCNTVQSALKAAGAQPISGCNFNFDSVLTDVATMAAAARVIEMVGVAAYLGGAAQLTDPVLLAAAASILTVEARHQTVLNILSGSGTAIPAAFDIAFTPNEVLAIAGPFISGCSVGVTGSSCLNLNQSRILFAHLTVPANTPLSITNNGSVTTGTTLTFSAASINGTSQDVSYFFACLVCFFNLEILIFTIEPILSNAHRRCLDSHPAAVVPVCRAKRH